MAIVRDASSPARFTITRSGSTTEGGTSASFTPPVGALLRCSVCINSSAAATPTFNVPSSTGGGVAAFTLVRSQTNAAGGAVAIFEALVTASVATTVSVSITNCGSQANVADAAAWVDVWTGAAASQVGAAVTGATSTTQNISPTLTTTQAGAQVHGVAVDWNALGSPTSSDTIDPYTIAGTSGCRVYKAANSGAPGSVAVNFVAAAAGPQWTYALAEILPANTSSGARRSGGQSRWRGPAAMPRFQPQRRAYTTVSAGQSVVVGLDTETDSAFSVGKRKAKTLGLVSQSSSSLALAKRKAKAVGLTTQASSAFAVARRKAKLLGLISSANAAFAVIAPHFISVGLASSANTAFAIARKKARALGLTTSAATAFALAHTKRRTLGLLTQTSTALAARATRLKAVGLAASTNTALAVGRLKRKVLGLPSSSSTAFSVTPTGPAPPAGGGIGGWIVDYLRRRLFLD